MSSLDTATTALKTRDVREGGAWTIPQRIKNDLIFAMASFALGAIRALSVRRVVAIARGMGALAFALAPRLRARALRNLSIAFPEMPARERRAIAKRAFRNLAAHVAETLAARARDEALPPLAFPESSRAILRDALAEGRGVVLPSAHLGPWERLAQTLVAHGFPLTAIVRESYDPRFDRIVDAARARSGVKTIARGAPGASTRIVRTLRAGGVLGIPMDLATRAESIVVPLLGAPAKTPVGPARIAVRTGAPIVVCTVEPCDGELAVTCTRIDLPSPAPRSSHVHDVTHATTRDVNAELGRRIRLSPEEWPWMHDRFA